MTDRLQPSRPTRAHFHTTRWELVRQAGDGGEAGREALEAFCRAYWFPLYAFLRGRGESPEDAADLVQGFFADFLGREQLSRLDEEGGRLRSFLLVALRNYASNERARQRAAKRGGEWQGFSIERQAAEERYRFDPADGRTAERAFERGWALTVIERALERLEGEQRERGRGELFAELVPFLSGNPPEGGLAAAAERVATTSGALKVALHRLRVRYRELMRLEVRDTLGEGDAVDAELDLLLDALESE